MINPHLVQPKYGKVNDFARANKYYVAIIGQDRVTRKTFSTATQALEYAERVTVSWRRLYDAAMKVQEPT